MILRTIHANFTGLKYGISFRSRNELCLFRFWCEDWYAGEVVYARSLFSIRGIDLQHFKSWMNHQDHPGEPSRTALVVFALVMSIGAVVLLLSHGAPK